MKYEVVLSQRAFIDLDEIFTYIAYHLQSAENAAAQISRIEAEIASLGQMPERYRRYHLEPWRSRGVRIMSVDHYCILYIPDNDRKTVTIIRVMYSGRDMDAILTQYEEDRQSTT